MNELVEVPILVHIRKNDTGEIRIYNDIIYFDDIYVWRDGNYSCDCNRRLFFARVNNEEEDWESGCGDTEYSVNIFLNNDCIYSEFDLQ